MKKLLPLILLVCISCTKVFVPIEKQYREYDALLIDRNNRKIKTSIPNAEVIELNIPIYHEQGKRIWYRPFKTHIIIEP